jgi:hypothetical protein
VELLVVLFQSQHLRHLQAHQPLVRGVEAQRRTEILLLRDPFNWAASYIEKSGGPGDACVWSRQWLEYAAEYAWETRHLPDAIRVNYNLWFTEPGYRRRLAERLGLAFSDRALETVTSHAGGSSFDGTRFDGRAQRMPVLERWKRYRDNRAYVDSLRQNPRVIEYARTIFALDPELERFAAACLPTGVPAAVRGEPHAP